MGCCQSKPQPPGLKGLTSPEPAPSSTTTADAVNPTTDQHTTTGGTASSVTTTLNNQEEAESICSVDDKSNAASTTAAASDVTADNDKELHAGGHAQHQHVQLPAAAKSMSSPLPPVAQQQPPDTTVRAR